MRFLYSLVLVLLCLGLLGCTGLRLPEPSGSDATILVLPFTITNRAQRTGPLGFHYLYEIESLDGDMEPVEVRFTRRLDADIMILDFLAPGSYRVRSFDMVPAGSGDHFYGDRRVELDLRFSLEAGAITVFMRSLNLEMYNSIPGRGSSTSYSVSLDDVTPSQYESITSALKSRPSFKSWRLRTPPPSVEDGLALVAPGNEA